MCDTNLKFARGGAELTLELFDKLKASTNKENILISPLSIQTCMALAFAGAQGATADEIAAAMKYVSNSSPEVAETFRFVLQQYKDSELLKIANKVYVQEGQTIRADYAAITKEQYHAAAESVNFADSEEAAKNINQWVESKTAGKITDLISANDLDADTRLVLLNALHFKGQWQNKFDKASTREDDFWLNAEESVKVPYMCHEEEYRVGYLAEYDCSALEMPYKDSDLSMFVLLPTKRDGLKDLAEKLKNVNLLDLSDKLNPAKEIVLKFPKFKIDYAVELSTVLQEMGITKAFGDNADLSGILESAQDIKISKVFHKTSIEINEEGAEAAAATGLQIMLCCMPMQFEVNHPFFYWIWNKKNILFAGAFVNPPAAT